jgi:hypothetical protein
MVIALSQGCSATSDETANDYETSGTEQAWGINNEIPGEISCFGGPRARAVAVHRDVLFKVANEACALGGGADYPPNLWNYHIDYPYPGVRTTTVGLNTTGTTWVLNQVDCESIARRIIDECDTNTESAKWGGVFRNGNSRWEIYACEGHSVDCY